MRRWMFAAITLVWISGCAVEPQFHPIPRAEPLSHATTATPEQVVTAARAVFGRLSLNVASSPGMNEVRTQPTIVHREWAPVPVSDRLICGAPFPRFSRVGEPYSQFDLSSAIDLTQSLPIQLQMRLQATDRIGGSTVHLTIQATALRPSPSPIIESRIACLPTNGFVAEIFRMLEAEMGG